ncbi:hypothetical protein M404DRAFT_999497 [Pisolithus tinctorius Marx 270]|uniref:Uncharacterized protein n=1 Tax=Pisolithus tinctorius Marx 270 TaxID=870435 RepID=A0A0C3PCJ1_PISTI|nr:hypothetical protein M404DRAFT_999497 [Pisolithus tinctorius Marx 270]
MIPLFVISAAGADTTPSQTGFGRPTHWLGPLPTPQPNATPKKKHVPGTRSLFAKFQLSSLIPVCIVYPPLRNPTHPPCSVQRSFL